MIKFIGCGTGRCGTTSISKLLDNCVNFQCYHELKPLLHWYNDDLLDRKITWLTNKRKKEVGIGDVAFSYLPHIPALFRSIPDLKVLCLKRDLNETVESFLNWRHKENRFLLGDRNEHLYPNFPKYAIPDRQKATEYYWLEYYRTAEEYEKEYNNFEIFPIDTLNTRKGQKEIFDYIELPNRNRVYMEKTIHNARKK